jgi:hypothetical protein
MRPTDQAAGFQDNTAKDAKTATDYLALARDVSSASAVEADLDSVKAFGLLVSVLFPCSSTFVSVTNLAKLLPRVWQVTPCATA